MRRSILLGPLGATLFVLGCGDDSVEDGSGGSTSSGSPTSSSATSVTSATSSTGAGPVTAESITAARCASFATDTPTPISGGADPPALMTPDGTLYEMSLHEVPEPTQYVGFVHVEIVEPGSYFLLVMQGDNDFNGGIGFIRELPGGPPTEDYVQCNDCFDVCDEVENAWVHVLSPATYEVGIMAQTVTSVRLLVVPVDQ